MCHLGINLNPESRINITFRATLLLLGYHPAEFSPSKPAPTHLP